MPLKPYAIDAIHLFLSGWRFRQEVVIEKCAFRALAGFTPQ